ncbi:unnamed protein product [Lymnaea stagnalis]|uniref:SMP-LTD domain-containing protein n=1 Tax=Lymnaea stagnalis TaxID=6523 RepID=A0AAV2HWR2_LYMST
MEFEDLLKTKTAVFVDELYLRDFSLGETMPVFSSMSVVNCQVHHDLIEALELKAELDYNGGFQVAIDAALPFGRMAFVSVKVLSLKGPLRLHFTKLPFSHWSMSFYEVRPNTFGLH